MKIFEEYLCHINNLFIYEHYISLQYQIQANRNSVENGIMKRKWLGICFGLWIKVSFARISFTVWQVCFSIFCISKEDILYQVPIFFILNIFWYKKFLIWINSWKLNYAVTWFDKVFVMGGLFWRISFIIFNPLFFTPIFLSSERGQCLLKLTKVLYDGITWF